jgi:hypothetical protein
VTAADTLALFREDPPADSSFALAGLEKDVAAFGLDLAIADRFHTDEGVVFLEPRPSADLERAHAPVHDRLGPDRGRVHAYYRPGAWRPPGSPGGVQGPGSNSHGAPFHAGCPA